MKRLFGKALSLILLVSYVAAVFSFNVASASSNASDFLVEDNMIVKYIGNDTDIIVPAVVDGVEIYGIKEGAFEFLDAKRVEFSEGIELINGYSFKNCGRLEKVVLPNSVFFVADRAFVNCPFVNIVAANTDYTVISDNAIYMEIISTSFFSDGVSSYGKYTVSGSSIVSYSGDDEEIVIPSEIGGVTITRLGDKLFMNNTKIKSVVIPDSIVDIGISVFEGCTSLESVVLSKNTQILNTQCFKACTALKQIAIPGTVKTWGQYTFASCSALTDVVLEEGLKTVGPYAFHYCVKLNSVVVPSTLTDIKYWAFGYCYELPAFNLPENIQYLDSAVFYMCKALNNIVMPSNITSIGTHCFRECHSLTNIVISPNLTSIPLRAFHKCGFNEIVIPQNVSSMGEGAFYQCLSLTHIELPVKLQSIGGNCFYYCPKLTDVTIYKDTKQIEATAFAESKKVNFYVEKNSYAQQYAMDLDIPYNILIENIYIQKDDDSYVIANRFNISQYAHYVNFGLKYIPEMLGKVEKARYVTLTYDFHQYETPEMTFFTEIKGIPKVAKDWNFIFIPFFIDKMGNEISDKVEQTSIIEAN